MFETTKYDVVRSGIVWSAVAIMVLIVFSALVNGCEQTEMTKREQVQLEKEKVKAGYERTQTNSVKVGQ